MKAKRIAGFHLKLFTDWHVLNCYVNFFKTSYSILWYYK